MVDRLCRPKGGVHNNVQNNFQLGTSEEVGDTVLRIVSHGSFGHHCVGDRA
jgi:hypothetical protein